MQTALIIAAAPEDDVQYLKELYHTLNAPLVLCADGGLEKARALRLPVDLHIGDMDSGKETGAQSVLLPAEKDFSDTEACVQAAVARGCRRIVLAGASGGRLDHLLCNLFLIGTLARQGVECMLVDARNMVCRAVSGRYPAQPHYRYVSLIPLEAELTDVNLSGVKYPLQHKTVQRGSSLTLSNEVTEDFFSVQIGAGEALLIYSRD